MFLYINFIFSFFDPKMILLFIFCSILFFQQIFTQNCYRFCSVTLRRGYFNIINENNINILSLEDCSHLVLDAYPDYGDVSLGETCFDFLMRLNISYIFVIPPAAG